MLTQEELHEIEQIKKKYPNNRAALMPVLYIVQEKYGWISNDAINYVSKLLDLPEVDILGVVTFYEMFHAKPKGKYLIELCTNLSCMLCNSEMVVKTVQEKIGIKFGETSLDNKFTLQEVECLGACGSAPVMSINDFYYSNLTERKINEIIDSLE